MKVVLILKFLLTLCQTILAWSPGDSQPHIVFVLADDLGNFTIFLRELISKNGQIMAETFPGKITVWCQNQNFSQKCTTKHMNF